MADVFISYSRKDIAFARLIQQAFEASQLKTWIDWQDIPPAQDWLREVYTAIEGADTFVFIISQPSLSSDVCRLEVQHALENNKRIIPIVAYDVDPRSVAECFPQLAALNWIFCLRDQAYQLVEVAEPENRLEALPRQPQFDEAFQRLTKAIRVDQAWVKEHTRLQTRALEWERKGKEISILLRGVELDEAEAWLRRAAGKDPQPTLLQAQYLSTSRQEETLRQKSELRRQRLTLAAVLVGLAVAIILGLVAWDQRNQFLNESQVRATAQAVAVDQSNRRATAQVLAEAASTQAVAQQATAQAASTQAIQQKNEAERQTRLALASKLTTDSSSLLDTDYDLALLLAAQAYQLEDNPGTRSALMKGLLANPRAVRYLPDEFGRTRMVAFSQDSRFLAVDSCVNYVAQEYACLESKVQLWDLASGKPTDAAFAGFSGRINWMGFSPDGKILHVVTSFGIYRAEIATQHVDFDHPFSSGEILLIQAVMSPSGERLALGACGEAGTESQGLCARGLLGFWDLEQRKMLNNGQLVHNGWVDSLAFHPGGAILAANIGNTGTVLFDATDPLNPVTLSILPVEMAESLAFSPDGNLLVVSTWDKEVQFWDVIDPSSPVRLEKSLTGFENVVSLLAIRPDGKLLATGSCLGENLRCLQGEIRLWDISSLSVIGNPAGAPLSGFANIPLALNFSQDGRFLASSDGQATILWQTENEQPLAKILNSVPYQTTTEAAFSPDSRVAVWSTGSTLSLWDLSQNEPVSLTMTGNSGPVSTLAFSEDGKTLLSSSGDNLATRWNAQTGQLIDRLISRQADFLLRRSAFSTTAQLLAITNPDNSISIMNIDTGVRVIPDLHFPAARVNDLVFSDDGKILAASYCALWVDNTCQEAHIRFWDSSTGEPWRPDLELESNLTEIAIHPNGTALAAAAMNDTILYWDLTASQPISLTFNGLGAPVSSLAFSPDGEILAAGGCAQMEKTNCRAGEVQMWDTTTLEQAGGSLNGHQSTVIHLVFSQDGKKLISSSNDESFIVWETGSGKRLGPDPLDEQPVITVSRVTSNGLAISPDGRRLAFASNWKGNIQLWDLEKLEPIGMPLDGHASRVFSVAFSADQRLLSFSNDATLDVWDLQSREVIAQPMDGFLYNPSALAFSPDRSRLASASCRIKVEENCSEVWVNFWNLDSEERLDPPIKIPVQWSRVSLAFTPDGKTLAVGTCSRYEDHRCTQSSLSFWSVASHAQLSDALEFPNEDLGGLEISPDGRWVASRNGSRNVFVWQFNSATSSFEGEPQVIPFSSVQSLAFSPDSTLLALGQSRLITIWDLESGRMFGQQLKENNGQISALAFSPNGSWLISGGNSGIVNLWDFDPTSWQARACEIANRTLTAQEWEIYLGEQPFDPVCR